MRAYDLTDRSDDTVLRELHAFASVECENTAALLARLGEAEERRLYAPAGYPTMNAYCVAEFGWNASCAYKRVQVARAARRFPALFGAIAANGLRLTVAGMVAPHLTTENVDGLLAAVTRRPRSEVEVYLAARFRPEEPPSLLAPVAQLLDSDPRREPAVDAPTVGFQTARAIEGSDSPPLDGPYRLHVLQLKLPPSTRDKLRRAQELLSHRASSRQPERVFDRALDALIRELEARKAGSPRPGAGGVARLRKKGSRTIPAHVRRAVWERDGGQCTFAATSGRRCGAHRLLEFDHLVPVSRGGGAAVENIRLRCRTHNRLEAERILGPAFVAGKLAQVQIARAAARGQARAAMAQSVTSNASTVANGAGPEVAPSVVQHDPCIQRDVIVGLRSLGIRTRDAQLAAQNAARAGGSIEDQMRAALRYLGRSVGRKSEPPRASPEPTEAKRVT